MYFNFLIVENNDNIGYVLESSVNDSKFKSIQIKEGFKSPDGKPLLYCYSEKLTINENTSYRIKRISSDGNINYSCPITITKNSKSKIWISCVEEENSILLVDIKEDIRPLNSEGKMIDENKVMKLGESLFLNEKKRK